MDTKRTRHSLTPEELDVWREFMAASERLRRALASGMQSRAGISPADYVVLLALYEAPGRRLRATALAEGVGWERSRLSHHLTRMERKELIAREGCASDNRVTEVTITAEGLRVFRRSSSYHFDLIRELFVNALTDDQLRDVQRAFAAIRSHLDSQGDLGLGESTLTY